MLITQYILNIAFKPYKYVGSGTIFVSGSASFKQIFNGAFSQQFVIGEYVYDQNHKIWQITSITGDANNPVYHVTASGETKSYSSYEIIKLNQEAIFFNNQYNSQIASYEQTIQKIDSIIPPPDIFNTGDISVEFVVGEYVYDQNHKIWQITSITGDATYPIYNAATEGETKSFIFTEIYKLNQETFFNNQYDSQISSYESTIQKIDSITPPPDTYNTGTTTPRFVVGEYVIDIENIMWIVLSIENNVDKILYTIYNSTGAKIVVEPEIYKLNQESQVMGSVYDQQIQEYQYLLNQINEKIINF